MNRYFIALILALLNSPISVLAQDLSALARILPDRSTLIDDGQAVELRLGLNQAVPYRIFTLDNPRRLILDFNEIDWTGLDIDAFDQSLKVSEPRVGLFRPGWSRMVLGLSHPLGVEVAALNTTGVDGASVLVRLVPVSGEEFTEKSGLPGDKIYRQPGQIADVAPPIQRQTGEKPLVVVLDPGHGGIDPGAEYDGVIEAELMLTFARELQETLLRAGNFTVVLTRVDDGFVPLETRVSIARGAGADVFLSLHADALAEGRASGATIYTLSETASDLASQKLSERHDRADLLAGVDLTGQDDVIATVLMELARTETKPRSDSLANALVASLLQTTGMHKHPRLSAGFSVLKAPDIPSVLIELGFLSSPRDLKKLRDQNWRKLAAEGIRDALQLWAITDAAEARLLRK